MAAVDVSQLNLLKEALDPVDNLQSPAVTERENQRETVVVCGLLDRFVQLRLAGLRQIRQATDRLEPNIFFHQLRRLFFQEALEQVHQRENFAFRALPVFGGKGIEGEELDPQIAAAFDAGADRVGAFFVAFDSRQSALLRPAAVAIHDNGDVARNRLERRIHFARSSGSVPAPGPR